MGTAKLAELPCKLFKFLSNINKLMAFQGELKNIQFILTTDNIPRSITLDYSKYQLVFLNVLSNSIKYTFKGYIKMHVSCCEERLITRIVDTGIGIKANELANIFNVLGNCEQKIAQASTGIGIGLTVSNQLVTMMGGKFNISSEEGKGTTVEFDVKFKPSTLQQIQIAKFASINLMASPIVVPSTKKHILIVDDTVFSLFALKSMLKILKITSVLEAYNGKQALEIYKEKWETIGLILMDINMPEMNGFDASFQINMLAKEKGGIAIVAVSAQMDDGYIKRASECGICKYSKILR